MEDGRLYSVQRLGTLGFIGSGPSVLSDGIRLRDNGWRALDINTISLCYKSKLQDITRRENESKKSSSEVFFFFFFFFFFWLFAFGVESLWFYLTMSSSSFACICRHIHQLHIYPRSLARSANNSLISASWRRAFVRPTGVVHVELLLYFLLACPLVLCTVQTSARAQDRCSILSLSLVYSSPTKKERSKEGTCDPIFLRIPEPRIWNRIERRTKNWNKHSWIIKYSCHVVFSSSSFPSSFPLGRQRN